MKHWKTKWKEAADHLDQRKQQWEKAVKKAPSFYKFIYEKIQ
jgi:hypothetical protein